MDEFLKMDADQRHRHLLNVLGRSVCQVTFTKVNGEQRIMPCTLRSEILPPKALSEHHQTRLYNPEVISVFCVDKLEWRSFRVMNVTDIKILE